MCELFIAHDRSDRTAVDMLDRAFSLLDFFVVFDDPATPRDRPQPWLKYAAEQATAVVACFSPRAMDSYVFNRDTASAHKAKALAPAIVSPCTLPSRYHYMDVADLSAWKGELDHPQFQRLLRNVSATFAEYVEIDLAREARLRARGAKSDIVALVRKILLERLQSHDEPMHFDQAVSELCKRAGAIGVDDVGSPMLEAALAELDAQNHRRREPPLSVMVTWPGVGTAEPFRGQPVLRLLPRRLAAEVHEECLNKVRQCEWD